jgi:hypothetical protein
MHVMDGPGREALPVASAALKGFRISPADIDRLDFGENFCAKQRTDILGCNLLVSFIGPRRDVRLDIFQPSRLYLEDNSIELWTDQARPKRVNANPP